ncbi:hypothetical protein R1sor_003205 [Riccia sorocarpa]|uniref:F-box domain-containing protein n=1 Tax=Riccia sorocarpa TaxID=122646 RepID=A0ABD3H1C3_9MARC
MDPEVWKHLTDHEDILRLIFSRVLWDTNLSLRLVSKAFQAMLSEPSLYTWSSMLAGTGFYANHPNLNWVDSIGIPAHGLKETPVNPVCLLSTSHTITFEVANFERQQWCKLPPLGRLPYGELSDFTVTGVAEGLLLLERKIHRYPISHRVTEYALNPNVDLYELDRFLFNPMTKEFMKLPVVPKVGDSLVNPETNYSLRYPMFVAVEKEKTVTVVATEFSKRPGDSWEPPRLTRILLWRQGGKEWEPLETNLSGTDVQTVHNAVFGGGELFLHSKDLRGGYPGDRVINCDRRAINPQLVLTGESYDLPVLHLFQLRGILRRLTGTKLHGFGRYHYLKLCTFDHLNGSWEEEDINMPMHMLKKLYASLADEGEYWRLFVDVLDDTLCVGNRFNPEVFLYNLPTEQWSECYVKQLVTPSPHDRKVFLWLEIIGDFLVWKQLKQDENRNCGEIKKEE